MLQCLRFSRELDDNGLEFYLCSLVKYFAFTTFSYVWKYFKLGFMGYPPLLIPDGPEFFMWSFITCLLLTH